MLANITYASSYYLNKSKIWVYTKNGKGYVHDNIPSAVISIKELSDANNFEVEVSDDPFVFNKSNLQKYKLIIFTSTNNDVFDTDEQRFRKLISVGKLY